MADKQLLIELCKHDRRRADGTGDTQYGIKLFISGKVVETYYFVARDDRDRAWDVISKDPVPWFQKHYPDPDDLIAMVQLPQDITDAVDNEAEHLVKAGEDYRPITDDERKSGDFGLCIPCTRKERKFIYHDMTKDPVEQAMKGHFMEMMKENYEEGMEWDEMDQLTPEVLDQMANYAARVINEIGVVRGAEFVQDVMREVAMGKREPIGKAQRIPDFVALSIQTDESGYPMFPDEIRDWIEAIRVKHDFPAEVRQIRHGGSMMGDQVTMEEMLCFCIYVEGLHPGAGKHIFGGRVKL